MRVILNLFVGVLLAAYGTAVAQSEQSPFVSAASAADRSDSVVIELLPEAATQGPFVSLGDVARISGGTEGLRSQFAGIDLADTPKTGAPEVITSSRVRLRLLLDRQTNAQFHLTGAGRVRVRRQDTPAAGMSQADRIATLEALIRAARTPETSPATSLLASRSRSNDSLVVTPASATQGEPDAAMPELSVTEEEIIDVVRETIGGTLGVPTESMEVRLRQPIQNLELISVPRSRLKLKAFMPFQSRPTAAPVRVAVYDGRRLVRQLLVPVDILFPQTIAVARMPINTGVALNDTNVSFETRKLTTPPQGNQREQILGMQARRAITAGDVILPRDVRQPSSETESGKDLIRQRDSIRLVARKGGIIVSIPAAEALDSGAYGQFISVRNPQSGRVVRARVVSRNEAHVAL